MNRIAMGYPNYLAGTGLNGDYEKRGSTIASVDSAFKFYHSLFDKADQPGQIALTLRLYEACKTWLEAKCAKDSTKGVGVFKKNNTNLIQRRMVISDVAKQCVAELGAINNMTQTKAGFETRKLNTLNQGKSTTPTTGLKGENTFERQTWLASGKTVAIAGSFFPTSQEMKNVGVQQKNFNALSGADFAKLNTLAKRQVLYLKKDDRLDMMLNAINGDAYRPDGVTRLDFALPTFPVPFAEQAFNVFYNALQMYAMDRYGNIFCSPQLDPNATVQLATAVGQANPAKVKAFNHSTFNAGKDVICAGLIGITAGKIIWLDSNSGHYKPTRENLKNAVQFLTDEGMDLAGLRVGAYKYNAQGHINGIDVYTRDAFVLNPNAPGNLAST